MAYFIKKKNMGSVDEIYMARRDNTGSDMDAYNYIMLVIDNLIIVLLLSIEA